MNEEGKVQGIGKVWSKYESYDNIEITRFFTIFIFLPHIHLSCLLKKYIGVFLSILLKLRISYLGTWLLIELSRLFTNRSKGNPVAIVSQVQQGHSNQQDPARTIQLVLFNLKYNKLYGFFKSKPKNIYFSCQIKWLNISLFRSFSYRQINLTWKVYLFQPFKWKILFNSLRTCKET